MGNALLPRTPLHSKCHLSLRVLNIDKKLRLPLRKNEVD